MSVVAGTSSPLLIVTQSVPSHIRAMMLALTVPPVWASEAVQVIAVGVRWKPTSATEGTSMPPAPTVAPVTLKPVRVGTGLCTANTCAGSIASMPQLVTAAEVWVVE